VVAKPFTVEHFRRWAAELVLDNDAPWTLEPFQAAFLRDLFAGFLECWLVIPEGNAKTTLAGGVILYHAQHTRFARVPVAASSRDQAEWLYQAAAGFVERSPAIEHLFRCQEGYRRIRCDSMGSRIQVFAADDRTGDGIIPTLAVLEELHRHRTLRLYRTWRGKIEKRGGQLAAISTAGEPDGEFEEVRRKMREGATSIRQRGGFLRAATKDYVLHEYAVPENRDPEVMRDVKMANPLKAITIPQLRRKFDSPSMTPGHWRRFVCGLPAGADEQPITPEQWDPLRADVGRVEDGEDVMLAPSIGGNAAVAVAAQRAEGRVAVRVFHVEPRPNRSTQALTEDLIVELCELYRVAEVHFPEGGFIRSAEMLEDRGLPIVGAHPSPSRLVAASGTFDRLLHERKLIHDGDPHTRTQILQAIKKVTEAGERYLPGDSSRAIGAVVMAVHAATAFYPEPYVGSPTVGLG
jgi:phage terminase large subunit-like protein